jgi:hypothetical protein
VPFGAVLGNSHLSWIPGRDGNLAPIARWRPVFGYLKMVASILPGLTSLAGVVTKAAIERSG